LSSPFEGLAGWLEACQYGQYFIGMAAAPIYLLTVSAPIKGIDIRPDVIGNLPSHICFGNGYGLQIALDAARERFKLLSRQSGFPNHFPDLLEIMVGLNIDDTFSL
jgi:hypothetical protein